MISFHTNDSHKKHHTLYYVNKQFFVVINQINKHKAKIYNHHIYTKIIIKTFFTFSIYKKFFFVKHKNDKSIIKRIKANSAN